jgi:hypothetical protein
MHDSPDPEDFPQNEPDFVAKLAGKAAGVSAHSCRRDPMQLLFAMSLI